MLTMIEDVPKNGGVIANGKKQLADRRNESLVMNIALERAIKEGGDPNGTLVNKQTFGVDVGAEHISLCLIPSQWKRWSVGIIGSISFAIATILMIGLSTRGIPKIARWVRDGFLKRG